MHQLLVIDQAKNGLYGAVDMLLQAGYNVQVADDPGDAHTMLQRHTDIAVILCEASVLVSDVALVDRLIQKSQRRLIVLVDNPNPSSLTGIRPIDQVVSKPIRKQELLRASLECMIAYAQQEAVQATRTFVADGLKSFLNTLDDLPFANPMFNTTRDPVDAIDENTSTVRALTIHHDRSEAVYRGQTLALTPTEFDILRLLAQAAGRVVTFEEIVHALQKVTVPRNEARRMISAHMTHLRMKMREAGCDDYLVNSRGRGYMLDNDVESVLEQKDAQLHLLLNQMPILLWNVDTNLQFTTFAGNYMLDTLRRTPDEFIGVSLIDFMGSSNTPAAVCHRQALNGIASQYEQEWQQHVFQVYVQPIYEDDQIVGCSGVAFDITERKQAEEQLHENRHFIERVISTSPNLIYVYDLMQQRNIYANEIAHKIFGYSPDQAQHVDLEFLGNILHPDDQHLMDNPTGRYANMPDGAVLENEFRLRHRDGGWRWVSTREVIFQRDAEGHPIQILGVLEDITERKQIEKALRDSEQRYRLISQAITNYTYGFEVAADGSLRADWIAGNFTDITGFTPEQVQQRGGWVSILHPDDMPIIQQRLERLMRGIDDTSEFRIITAQNDVRSMRDYGHAIWDEAQQRVVYIVGAAQDITMHKEQHSKDFDEI